MGPKPATSDTLRCGESIVFCCAGLHGFGLPVVICGPDPRQADAPWELRILHQLIPHFRLVALDAQFLSRRFTQVLGAASRLSSPQITTMTGLFVFVVLHTRAQMLKCLCVQSMFMCSTMLRTERRCLDRMLAASSALHALFPYSNGVFGASSNHHAHTCTDPPMAE